MKRTANTRGVRKSLDYMHFTYTCWARGVVEAAWGVGEAWTLVLSSSPIDRRLDSTAEALVFLRPLLDL